MNNHKLDPDFQKVNSVYASIQQVAQSMEVDGRTEEQKAIMSGGSIQAENKEGVVNFTKGKTDSTILKSKSPRQRSPIGKVGNGSNTQQSSQSRGAGLQIAANNFVSLTASKDTASAIKQQNSIVTASSQISRHEGGQKGVASEPLSASPELSQKSKKDRGQSKRGGGGAVTSTSENQKSTKSKKESKESKEVLSPMEIKRKIQESYETVWEQHKSDFVTLHIQQTLLDNSLITLGSLKKQPQQADIYKHISKNVCGIWHERERKLESRRKQKPVERDIFKSTDTPSNNAVSQAGNESSTSKARLLNLSNKSSFRNQINVKTLQQVNKGAPMPIVSEVQELDAKSGNDFNGDGLAPNTTENVQTSMASLDSEAYQALSDGQPAASGNNALNFIRQQTHGINNKLKQITEMSQLSQDNDDIGGKSMPLHHGESTSGQKKQYETVAIEDQKETLKHSQLPSSLNHAMIDKLLKGEQADGIFKRVKIEQANEQESCVFRLGDLDPDQFTQKQRGISQPIQRSLNRKQQMKQEIARSFRLDAKLTTVVGIAKKKLAKSPEGKKVFRQIVQDLHLKDKISESDDDEKGWDMNREMKKFRAGSKHQQIADQRLREKLVRLNKIKDTKELEHVDSLIESAYNSQKAFDFAKKNFESPGDPCPSFESEEDLDLYSQHSAEDSLDYEESIDIETMIKAAGKLTMSTKNNPLDQMKMAMLGFEPGFQDQDSEKLLATIKNKIAEMQQSGTKIPEETTKVIYQRLCAEFQTAPINIFKHYSRKDSTLKFENYGLNFKQSQPITYILPYIQQLNKLVMKNCNLNDAAASMLIRSSLGNSSNLRHIDFTGIEMGSKFIKALKSTLEQDPNCLEELIMAKIKQSVSIGYLADTLLLCKNLLYLDLNANTFNFYSIEALTKFLKATETLEYLSMSQCQLRGKIAEQVIDALMLNKTLKYLDLSLNRFTSPDYMISAKLGRLVQGHPNLMHVDLANNQLSREELIYLVLSVRDSKNVQGIHLTGNRFSHYDRELMRALMPCKVRWPFPQNYHPKFEKVAARDKVTLIMLNLCFLTTMPPNYMPEIGLSNVQSVEEVRDKIRSSETRRQLEEQIQFNEYREYKKSEIRYQDVILQRMDAVQKQRKANSQFDVFTSTHNSVGELDGIAPVLDIRDTLVSDRSEKDLKKPYRSKMFQQYYEEADRMFDMFTMIDFYGRKRRCLELGHPLTKEDDKWYKDQRYRLQQRIAVLKKTGMLDPDAWQEITDLKKQLQTIMPLIMSDTDPKHNANNNNQAKKIQDQKSESITSLSLSELDEMTGQTPIMSGRGEGEEKEKNLQRWLKKITKEGQQDHERKKAIEAAQSNAHVITRVKQLLQLPPDHVPEVGCFSNPMRQDRKQEELIFTRVTGHPNIQDNNVWYDTNECWVCSRHNKLSVSVSMVDKVIDQEFQDIIVLTAMMTKRAQRRIDETMDQEAPLEIMLEEKSRKSEDSTGDVSDTSGSGADITGDGHPAYHNQKKQNRRALFRELQDNNVLGSKPAHMASREGFDEDQDDDEEQVEELEPTKQKDKVAKAAQRIVEKDDQSRAVDFAMYQIPKNVIQVQNNSSNTIEITQQPESNITLYNPHLTARPIQLKNVLKTVYQEYKGPNAPDRFNQKDHKYHAINGVLYRNLANNNDYFEGLSRAGGGKKKESNSNATSPTMRGDTAAQKKRTAKLDGAAALSQSSARELKETQISSVELTNEQYLYVTDKHLTKFEIADSVISKEIEHIHAKECFTNRQTPQENSQLSNIGKKAIKQFHDTAGGSLFSGKRAEHVEQHPHVMWLAKKGIGPDGQLPPVKIKDSGRLFDHINVDFARNALQTADGAGKTRRTMSQSTNKLNQTGNQAHKRLASTSHVVTRSLMASRGGGPNSSRRRGFTIVGATSGTPSETPMQGVQNRYKTLKSGIQNKQFGTTLEIDNVAQSLAATAAVLDSKSKEKITHIAYNPRVVPKDENEDNFKPFWSIFGQKEENDSIYLVSSVNHWQPIKMLDYVAIAAEIAAKKEAAAANKANTSRSRSSVPGTNKNVTTEQTPAGGTSKANMNFASHSNQQTSSFAYHYRGGDKVAEKVEKPDIKTQVRQMFANNRQRFVIQSFYKPAPCKVESCEGHKIPQCPGHDSGLIKVSCQIDRDKLKSQLIAHAKGADLLKLKAQQAKTNQLNRMPSPRGARKLEEEQAAAKQLEVHLFCRPGKHHFFFIRKGKHFMLSSNFKIEKYKETNVCMNYVEVPERGWKIDKPMLDRDTEWREIADQVEDGAHSFDKQRSVFRPFKFDTPQLLEEMFHNDIKLTKIPSKIKDKDQLDKVKTALLELYPKIKNMFLVLSCDSQYPAVNKQDFDVWALSCRFQDRPNVDEAKINLQREGSIVKNENTKRIETAKNEMLRFQFLECIFRLAELCYQNEIKQDSGAGPKNAPKKKKGGKIYMFQAITKVFKEYIDPAGFEVADTMDFREQLLYTYQVNQYLERNEIPLKKIHQEYNYGGKYYMKLEDAMYFVQTIGGLSFIPDRTVKRMYGYSKQSCVDYEKTPNFPKQLHYVEFLEFFGRIAYWVFEHDIEGLFKEMDLAEKIDGLLAHYCKKLRLQRHFSLIREDQNDIVNNVIEQVKAERLRNTMKVEDTDHMVTDSMIDESQSLYTDAASQAHLNPDKSQQTTGERGDTSGEQKDSSQAQVYHKDLSDSEKQKSIIAMFQRSKAMKAPSKKSSPEEPRDLRLDLDKLPKVSELASPKNEEGNL